PRSECRPSATRPPGVCRLGVNSASPYTNVKSGKKAFMMSFSFPVLLLAFGWSAAEQALVVLRDCHVVDAALVRGFFAFPVADPDAARIAFDDPAQLFEVGALCFVPQSR